MAWIVTWLAEQGHREAALLVITMAECYFRPAEVHRLRVRDVVGATPSAGPEHQFAALVLHPLEEGNASKTNEFDESLLLDLPRQKDIGPALLRLGRRRATPEALLFNVTQREVKKLLATAVRELALQPLGEGHPYRLRHSGAAHDLAAKERTLVEIQDRGR